MTEVTLTKTRIRAGWWEGVLTGAGGLPELEVVLNTEVLQGLTVTPVPGSTDHAVRVPIPPDVLSEGVQTFIIRRKDGDRLAHFTIVSGVALDDDLRAEIDLLRAELDLLKQAFRQHCAQTPA